MLLHLSLITAPTPRPSNGCVLPINSHNPQKSFRDINNHGRVGVLKWVISACLGTGRHTLKSAQVRKDKHLPHKLETEEAAITRRQIKRPVRTGLDNPSRRKPRMSQWVTWGINGYVSSVRVKTRHSLSPCLPFLSKHEKAPTSGGGGLGGLGGPGGASRRSQGLEQ